MASMKSSLILFVLSVLSLWLSDRASRHGILGLIDLSWGPSKFLFVAPVGYYLYMDSSQAQPKDTARVSYTFTSVSESYCRMSFFYHMYGTGMGVLRVFVEPKDGQRTEVIHNFL